MTFETYLFLGKIDHFLTFYKGGAPLTMLRENQCSPFHVKGSPLLSNGALYLTIGGRQSCYRKIWDLPPFSKGHLQMDEVVLVDSYTMALS